MSDLGSKLTHSSIGGNVMCIKVHFVNLVWTALYITLMLIESSTGRYRGLSQSSTLNCVCVIHFGGISAYRYLILLK